MTASSAIDSTALDSTTTAASAADPKASELAEAVSQSWRRFLEVYEPLRPALYRFCRYLSRSPWDAEDLVQDALARAFATLGGLIEPPRDPRAWLFRVASNLWIDHVRRRDARPSSAAAAGPERDEPGVAASAAPGRETREAAGTLLVQLSPQERAAVVLKDAFDLGSDEIAEILATSVGAVKAALHRGRGKLAAPDPDVSSDGERIARLRNYFYTPEIIVELCGELDVPCRTNGTFRARGEA